MTAKEVQPLIQVVAKQPVVTGNLLRGKLLEAATQERQPGLNLKRLSANDSFTSDKDIDLPQPSRT